METLFDITQKIAEAQGIASPIPPLFDVVFSIYQELGGSKDKFNSIYDILQAMLDEGLVSGGGGVTPSGSLEILENGNYRVYDFASASVNVPQGVFPEGTINITENGEYEVRNYDSASISVPQGIFPSGNLSITENGDYNVENSVSTSVNVPQGVFPEGTLNITQSGIYEVTTYSSASVNVPTGSGEGIDLNKGIRFANSTFSSLPQEILDANWSECTSSQEMFANCKQLVSMSYVDTSNSSIFSAMFTTCESLVYVPLLDTSKGTAFNVMFRDCKNLTNIPAFNLSSASRIDYMFYGCTKLVSVPSMDTSRCDTFGNCFYGCTSLRSIGKLDFSNAMSNFTTSDFRNCTALEDVEGFTGLRKNLTLQYSPNLTRQSVINILTEAADLTGQTGATLTLHADAKARITQDEYDLAASKNWTIA